jgi:PhzF family phenazine biosynthesis protein
VSPRPRPAPGPEARRLPYAIVDVFADRPLAGNPLAVVTHEDDLDEQQMAAIAVELNLSETTFVSPPTLPGADFRLRCFTPGGDEVTGAGHNALGAWWWLATTGAARPPGATQELGGRSLPVHIDSAGEALTIGLDQGPVTLSRPAIDEHALREALSGGDDVRLDPELPVAAGSVGSNHLLVPVTTRGEVDALDPDRRALARLLASTGTQGCYAYSVEAADDGHDAYCRFFNPTVGISEDPATGSAAGPLAAFLRERGVAGAHVRVRQGRAMGRPSTLDLRVGPDGTRLTGRCALAATGELHL